MLGLTAAVATCARQRTTPPGDGAVADAGLDLDVEWAGCSEIRRGPLCGLGTERKVTLWLADGAGSGWTLATERGPMGAAAETGVDGGTRLSVEVPRGTRQLLLRDGAGRTRWTLAVADTRPNEQIDRLVTHGRGGKYQEALEQLQTLQASVTPDQRGPLAAAMGRMALGLGQVDRAEPYFRTAIAAAAAEGRLSDAVKDSAGLFWGMVHLQQRYADAHALLAREMTAAGAQTPEGRVWLDYHAGLLAADTADMRTAMEKYRRAGRAARRVGLTAMADMSGREMARLLTRIGRPAEALPLFAASAATQDSCARATRALNIVWAWIEREAIESTPEGRRERALAVTAADRATRDCPDPHRRAMALSYAVDAALQTGDRTAAEPYVAELERTGRDEHDALHSSRRAEVLGRWYLAAGAAAKALPLFERELPAARARGLLEEIFRCQVGAGRALLALGQRGAAVKRLREAESLLETMLRGVPLGEGRGGFLSGRDEGIRYLVEALVSSGDPAQALRAARLARSAELMHAARLDRLSHLSADDRRRWDDALGRYQRIRAAMEREAADDWTVPRQQLAQRRAARTTQAEQARAALDEAFALLGTGGGRAGDVTLAEPGEGEVFLACFPGAAGWLAFAATAPGRVAVRRVEAADLESTQTAERVLALFTSALRGARRVRLLPYGAADRLDWQMVLWRGKPLQAALEVEYGLDVGSAPRPAAPERPQPAALVVSNPTGDLAAAAAEATVVTSALGGWRVVRLEGPQATRDALLQSLPGTRLFHYAGHAQISPSDGLSSALLLGANGRVELGDLLALPAVPELVVLPACEAAGNLEGGRSALGLAQAFIASGARVAVAPVRPIRDAAVAAFVRAFYAALGPSAVAPHDAVESSRRAFHSAALAVGAETRNGMGASQPAGTGCEGLRLLVP